MSLTERADALATDPVALGVIGALSIGVAAAAAFAIVGFIVSAAVSARERVTEFALLRALGLSSGQLSGWLSLENATLAVISLVAGTALGLLIAWVALPFVTVTRSAETAFPPVEVAVPVDDDRSARGRRHRRPGTGHRRAHLVARPHRHGVGAAHG